MLNHAHLKTANLTEGQLKVTISAISQGTFELISTHSVIEGQFRTPETTIMIGSENITPNFHIKLITDASIETNFMSIIGGVCHLLGTTLFLVETDETYFVYANKMYDQCEECIICIDKPPEVLLPCGHTCMCDDCAGNFFKDQSEPIKVCPICRAPIIDILTATSS